MEIYQSPSELEISACCPVPRGTGLVLDTGRYVPFNKWYVEIVDCRIELKGSLGPLGRAKQGHITGRSVVKQIMALVVKDLPMNRLFIIDLPVSSDSDKRGLVQFNLPDNNPFAVPDGENKPKVMVHGRAIALPSYLYLANAGVQYMLGNITVPCGLLISPVAASPGQWRKVSVFSLVDCNAFTEIEPGRLDDGVEMELTLTV